jgi:hypothetical protein
MLRTRLLALSALAVMLVPAGNALAAGSGGVGIRLVDVPAHSRTTPLARVYIVDQVAPGTTIRRRVEISNSTQYALPVQVYSAAAGLSHGRFAFAPGHRHNDISDWTSVSRQVLQLPPGARAFETVTVNVPRSATSGERYAVVWAQISAAGSASGGVRLVNRVGVRMYLSIGPGGALRTNFTIDSLTASRSRIGEPLVTAMIRNNGRRTIEIGGNLTLSKGPGGLRVGPLPATLTTALAPGDTRPLTVRLDKRLPRGPWRAQMRLRSGLIHRGAVARITFPRAHSATATSPRTAAVSRRLMAIIAIILFVLLAGTASALVLARRGA